MTISTGLENFSEVFEWFLWCKKIILILKIGKLLGKARRERKSQKKIKENFFSPLDLNFPSGACGAAGHFPGACVCAEIYEQKQNISTNFRSLCWWLFGVSPPPSPDRRSIVNRLEFSSACQRIFVRNFNEEVEFRHLHRENSIIFRKTPSRWPESGWFYTIWPSALGSRILAKNLFAFNQASSSTFAAAESQARPAKAANRARERK